MPEHFDAIIIGAGQAGPALAVRCGKEGLNTAIIERHRFGGTCVNNGCVPTKTLVASARAAHVTRRAADYGVMLDAPARIDMARVMARKDSIVKQSREGVRSWLDGAANVTVIEGHAQFTAPKRIQVGERVLEAPRIFINVGGRAVLPKLEGIGEVPTLNNEGIMHLTEVPAHLIIIGGSYIGLEFAQMMRRFGARVTVVETGPRLIGREDEDVSEAIREVLAGEGVDIRLNATCLALKKTATGVAVTLGCGDGEPLVAGSHILLATGRMPNTGDLGLAAAGIKADARGYVTVDEGLATSVPGVYALGDCNGRGAFTHTSWNDYEIVSQNLFDGKDRKVGQRISTYALFVDPPLGRVGLTETQVRESGRAALHAKIPMTRVGRAREMGETKGFMKICVAKDSGEILGAAILGVSGDEVVQSILEVMGARASWTSITSGTHIHPTVSELLPTLLEGLKPMK